MTETLHEQQAANAFDRQAGVFDALYAGDVIVQYKRQRIRDHVNRFLKPNATILELNAGTGEDALYFATAGHRIHATDISESMQYQLRQKAIAANLQGAITTEICSFNHLETLKHTGPFDMVFSNLAGLNCTPDIQKVVLDCIPLIKPGGLLTAVIMPPFCLWESMLMFKGNFKTAFRRFAGAKGAEAHIEGVYFRCWYYRPARIRQIASGKLKCVGLEGLCTTVPPSYLVHFPAKHKTIYSRLQRLENRIKTWPLFRAIGDYYILTLQKL